MIKDSYSLPVAAFLSTCINELHMVDLRESPTVNLKNYINENDFDAVILMYNTEVFNDIMFNFDGDKQKKQGCDLMLELEEANLTLKEYEKKLNELRGSL